MSDSKPVQMVCSHCGSAEVSADAAARWNSESQEWEVSNVFDKGHSCDDCGGECRLEEVDLAEWEGRNGPLKTFVFECEYTDDDAGGRCDVVRAYNRNQAIRLAAMKMIEDNEWTDGSHRYTSLQDAFDEELEVLHEWGDLDGSACPNCTSHAGTHAGSGIFEGELLDVIECRACHFQWIPLKIADDAPKPTYEEIEAQLAAFEATINESEEEEDGE